MQKDFFENLILTSFWRQNDVTFGNFGHFDTKNIYFINYEAEICTMNKNGLAYLQGNFTRNPNM